MLRYNILYFLEHQSARGTTMQHTTNTHQTSCLACKKKILTNYVLDLFDDYIVEIEENLKIDQLCDHEKLAIIRNISFKCFSYKNAYFRDYDQQVETIKDWLLGLGYPVEFMNYEIEKRFDLDPDTYWHLLAVVIQEGALAYCDYEY